MKNLVLWVSVLFVVVGGSLYAGGSSARSKSETLELLVWNDQEPYIKAVLEEYKKISDAKFNLTTVPADGDEYDNKLKVLLAANTGLDIFGIKTIAQLMQFTEAGKLQDLTDMISSKNLDISKYGKIFTDVSTNNRYYSLPMRSSAWVLFYNAALFDEAGIKYPGQMTWSEYASLAKQLTKGSGSSKQWGGYWVSWGPMLNFFAVQNRSYLTDANLTPLRRNLELFNQFYNVDKSHMGIAEMSSTGSNWLGEFENGKVAMLPNGEWVVGSILQDIADGKTNVKWEIAPMPIPDGAEPGTTIGGFTPVSISSTSKNKAAAFDFLSFLCGEQGAEIFAKMGLIPAYSSAKTAEAFTAASGKASAGIFFETNKIMQDLTDPKYNELVNAFAEHAELYLLGEKTLDQTIENFTTQRTRIMGR
ncbi:sugar ABC transporter substrate-binding protein [Spirochaetia bacterium]|nr:sugar ABC transporter substrate-binding protein [Spirochaetia bacterium]